VYINIWVCIAKVVAIFCSLKVVDALKIVRNEGEIVGVKYIGK